MHKLGAALKKFEAKAGEAGALEKENKQLKKELAELKAQLNAAPSSSSAGGPTRRSFATVKFKACETCGHLPRQDPASKGGWQNKIIAMIVAAETNNMDLLKALLKTLI